jgi:hypothetical protein
MTEEFVLTEKCVTELQELLRSNYDTNLFKFLAQYTTESLETQLVYLMNMQKKIISTLSDNFADEILPIVTNIFKGRSQYSFIKNGSDFIRYVHYKVDSELFLYLVEFYAINIHIQHVKRELLNRIKFRDLEID